LLITWPSRYLPENIVINREEFFSFQVEVCTMWGVRLVIIVQKKHRHSINRVQRSSVRTGIANTLGMPYLTF